MKRIAIALFIIVSLTAASTSDVARDRGCLAVAVFKEANSTSVRSQKAVLQVVQNRMSAQHKSACAIVQQPRQFSWYHGVIPTANKKMLDNISKLEHTKPVVGKGVMWFHNTHVQPKWANNMQLVTTIDGQKFYKMRKNNYD